MLFTHVYQLLVVIKFLTVSKMVGLTMLIKKELEMQTIETALVIIRRPLILF